MTSITCLCMGHLLHVPMELESVFHGFLFQLAESHYGSKVPAASLCLRFASADFLLLLATSETQIAHSAE